MKLSQSQSKLINPWLYVLLSIPPFICLYPLKKLKKIRLMLAINLGVLGASYLMVFLLSLNGYHTQNGPTVLTASITTVIQCILVYNWVKQHNQKISQSQIP